jgi:hypothetical protein
MLHLDLYVSLLGRPCRVPDTSITGPDVNTSPPRGRWTLHKQPMPFPHNLPMHLQTSLTSPLHHRQRHRRSRRRLFSATRKAFRQGSSSKLETMLPLRPIRQWYVCESIPIEQWDALLTADCILLRHTTIAGPLQPSSCQLVLQESTTQPRL